MAWRVVTVQSEAYLSLAQGQLKISIADRCQSLPIEDIDTLILDNLHSALSAALLCELAQSGVSVLFTNKKHLPCSLLIPTAKHSRQLSSLRLFDSLSKPQRKRLWQEIIKRKLLNQSHTARIHDQAALAQYLESAAKNVTPGDTKNIEAIAAAAYFKALWPSSRRVECWHNSMANLGYAIIRSSLARYLVAFGFTPSIGLHHCSDTNPFNLADDFLEPFRPLVDNAVLKRAAERSTSSSDLSSDDRRYLIQLLGREVGLTGDRQGERTQLLNVPEVLIRSFRKFLQTDRQLPSSLPLPYEP